MTINLRSLASGRTNASSRTLASGETLASSRSLGISPIDLGTLILWCSADGPLYTDSALTTIAVNDGDRVGGWKDMSGGSNNLLQATSSKRATLKLNIQNGYPVVRFDGVTQFLSSLFTTTAQPVTVFLACKQTSGTYIYDGAVNNSGTLMYTLGNLRVNYGTSNCQYVESQPIGFSVLTVLANGANCILRKDGVQKVKNNSGTNNQNGIFLGAAFNGTANSALDVGEILIYAANMTSKFSQIETYLKNRWGTP